MSQTIRLGLIGAGISRSEAPRLHCAAARLCGLKVSYELLDLEPLESQRLPALLERCREQRYAGINVTHPYKQAVAELIAAQDPLVRAIGTVNTVRFESLSRSFNTDHSGFMRAYDHRTLGPPGAVAIAGAGGVGRALAFALARIGATSLRLFDVDTGKTAALADALERSFRECTVTSCASIGEAADGADGLVNCSALGMHNHPGSAFPVALITRQRWAFDAVYTPRDTEFLTAAKKAGLAVLSGYELFFYQGIDAFRIFTGESVDETALRAALA